MSKKFYDTNALLLLQEKVLDLDDNDIFYISSETLIELEHIKVSKNKDEKTRYEARKVLHILNDNESKYHVICVNNDIINIIKSFGLEETSDNKICACAYLIPDINSITFVTNDLACKMIAKNIFGLQVQSVNENNDEIYKGYKVISGTTSEINEKMENMDLSEWCVNEYLIIENKDDGSIKEMKFNGEKLVPLKLPPSKCIKAKNSLQRCALDLLNNSDITIAVVLGTFGSGKSYLCTKMALHNVLDTGNQSKIVCVRNPVGEGESIGWLKGDFNEKTKSFFLPIQQQLDGGEFELESLKQRGVIESNIPYYMKGCTYPSSIILVDEAEDLNEKEIKLIGTRIGENGRVFMSGDFRQSIINNTRNNALVRMCNEFKGNPKFACICLDEDVRSETSKMFAELFEK